MVTCDKCATEFEIKVKEKKYSVSVRETYFRCPSCKNHYSVIFTNPEARKLQRKVKGLKNVTGNRVAKLNMKNRIKEISDELRRNHLRVVE